MERAPKVVRCTILAVLVIGTAVIAPRTSVPEIGGGIAPTLAAARDDAPKHIDATRTIAPHVLAQARAQARKLTPVSLWPLRAPTLSLVRRAPVAPSLRDDRAFHWHAALPKRAPPSVLRG